MIIQQISVFVENRPGTLAEVLAALNEHGINIRAMSVADTADFGILRFIVNQPERVEKLLREAQFAVKTTPVLTMPLEDQPGGLLAQINKLSSAGVNIEYFYAFATAGAQQARIVLKVDDLKRAEALLGPEVAGGTSQDVDFYW